MIEVLAPLPVLLPLLGAAGALLVSGHPTFQRALSTTVLTAVPAGLRGMPLRARDEGPTSVSARGLAGPLRIGTVGERPSALMLRAAVPPRVSST